MTALDAPAQHDTILIIDFGSQVTQLIARRVRETGVYCEIHPFQHAAEAFERLKPKGVIFSGGPASVMDENSPRAPQAVFDTGVPILAICYGQQTAALQLGGVVEGGHAAEFGRADVEIREPSPLYAGFWEVGQRYPVWMSHGDRVTVLPEGFVVAGTSENAPFAIAVNEERRIYTTMFHPEVVHTPDGGKLLANFVHNIVGLKSDWTMAAFREEAIRRIREQVGSERVICGLSGGVDSSVAAVLIHEAIGDQLTCVFVDHGLLRLGEAQKVVTLFRDSYNIPLVHVDAGDMFLNALAGVTDPEVKRKTIGKLFIDVFEEEARKVGGAAFLAQGTLYPDVIESVSFTGGPSVTIKSHHNVGGLPRAHEHEAGGAAARALQGRGARARPRARPAGDLRRPPSVPRPGPRHPLPRRDHPREAGYPAPRRRDLSRRDPPPRPLRRHLAGLRGDIAGEDRGRDGRLPHL